MKLLHNIIPTVWEELYKWVTLNQLIAIANKALNNDFHKTGMHIPVVWNKYMGIISHVVNQYLKNLKCEIIDFFLDSLLCSKHS